MKRRGGGINPRSAGSGFALAGPTLEAWFGIMLGALLSVGTSPDLLTADRPRRPLPERRRRQALLGRQ